MTGSKTKGDLRPSIRRRSLLGGAFGLAVALSFGLPAEVAHARERVEVVCTIPDLAHLAKEIGGDAVRVTALTSGNEDFHAVRPRPRLLVALSRAELLLTVGLDLEHSWLPPLLQSASNEAIQPGRPGHVDVSSGIEALEVPCESEARAGGHLHMKGNPHYNLSPSRMRIASANVLGGLLAVRPESRSMFEERHRDFCRRLDAKIEEWTLRMAPARGAALIEDHKTWAYFADEFDLRIVGEIEPKPGADPSPRQLARLIELSVREEVRWVVCRPELEILARKITRGSEARILALDAASRRDEKGGYIGFIDRIVEAFVGSAGT